LYLAVSAGWLAGTLFVVQAILLSSVVHRVFRLGQTLANVLPVLGVMLGLLALRAGLIWAQEGLAQRSASAVKETLRRQFTAHLYALGPAYTRGERSGELVNTLVEGVEALDATITQFLPARYLAGLVPAVVFLAVLLLDPWSTLVLLFAGPMLILLLALIGGRARAITERRFLELSWMSAFFLDVLLGLATLKMFGRSREQADTIEEISRHYGKTTMEVLATAFQTSLMMEWAATAATAMVALEVSLRVMSGGLQFDRALAVLLLTPEFFLPLRQLAIKYHIGATGKAAAERIFAILDLPAQRQSARASEGQHDLTTTLSHNLTTSRSHDLTTSPAEIRFEDVSVAYQQGERPALQAFSLVLPRGQTVALVGPTGAGKTTVANVLLRFVEPDAGQVLVDGQPLDRIDRAAWRRQVAWVPQLPHLFHGTAADNIRLARPEASLDDVIAAAQAAHAHEFIQALPQGYATPLGEQGARLSGGQRQRLAIARAFLKDAPLLILDEATASLDAASDALIRDALARLMAGRTVLVIAHRLELAYTADQVVVMAAGRAAESGAHRDLLARDGLYRQLVASYEAV
jgi:ATP-binding cassette subfamily C protein CydD